MNPFAQINPEERAGQARENFFGGCSCCQSVVLAFKDLLPIDEKVLMHMTSSLGAGVGRMREVCGAVSGMALVLGVFYGSENTDPNEIKGAHYARIQETAKAFTEKHGSCICRDLLNLPPGMSDPMPKPRTPEYYKTRPCPGFIETAAHLTAEYLKTHDPIHAIN